MKNDKNGIETSTLSTDSESRLFAYTTAASLGAFFASQSTEAQIVESQAFAPYPATILPPPGGGGVYIANGPGGFSGYYHYFNIDGGTNAEFGLSISAPTANPPSGPFDNQFVDLVGVGTNNAALTPTYSQPNSGGHTNDSYLVSFAGGSIISAATASQPYYQPRLALAYVVRSVYGGYYNYLDNFYITTGALGFQFISSVDHQLHFGYMDVQVNTKKDSYGSYAVQSVVIKDIYYNATPNAPITVAVAVAITNVTLTAGNAVTINFMSNDNAPASDFTLETSPSLGASANWTVDPNASISLVTPGNNAHGANQAYYQATTTAVGGPAQFYRIMDSN